MAAFLEKPNLALGERCDHDLDLVVVCRVNPPESRPLLGGVIPALEKEHMAVDVEVQAAAESLDQSDGAGLKWSTEARLFDLFRM
jgi:hypothetical protein